MTPEEKDLVMREGWEVWELEQRTNPEPINPDAFVYGYFVGTHTERESMTKELKESNAIIKELLRALYHGERELKITYERHTPYKGGSSLWLMQEMLEKYKYYIDEGKEDAL